MYNYNKEKVRDTSLMDPFGYPVYEDIDTAAKKEDQGESQERNPQESAQDSRNESQEY